MLCIIVYSTTRWPWRWFTFCTVVVVAVMDLAVIVLRVAVMDLFWGRYRLWPSLIWPSLFVAVMDLAVIVFHVAVMVCGRHSRSPKHRIHQYGNTYTSKS